MTCICDVHGNSSMIWYYLSSHSTTHYTCQSTKTHCNDFQNKYSQEMLEIWQWFIERDKFLFIKRISAFKLNLFFIILSVVVFFSFNHEYQSDVFPLRRCDRNHGSWPTCRRYRTGCNILWWNGRIVCFYHQFWRYILFCISVILFIYR